MKKCKKEAEKMCEQDYLLILVGMISLRRVTHRWGSTKRQWVINGEIQVIIWAGGNFCKKNGS